MKRIQERKSANFANVSYFVLISFMFICTRSFQRVSSFQLSSPLSSSPFTRRNRNEQHHQTQSTFSKTTIIDMRESSSQLRMISTPVKTEMSKENIAKSLSKKTVKELRDLLKDLREKSTSRDSIPPVSTFKLKIDLVEFLSEYIHSQMNLRNNKTTQTTKPSTNTKNKKEKKAMTSMPPLSQDNDTINSSSDKKNKQFKSKKDIMYEFVSERYPGLLTTNEKKRLKKQMYLNGRLSDNITLNGDSDVEAQEDDEEDSTEDYVREDIRSKYHPILKDAPNSSDLDISFVGTASCTPGLTRGVSCTAIRLNWRRGKEMLLNSQAANVGVAKNKSEKQKKKKVTNYEFTGGTWVFDVGECTQLQVQKSPTVKPGKITKIFITHCHGDHSFGLPGLLCLMGQDNTGKTGDERPIEIYGPEGLRMWLRVAIRYSMSRIVPKYVVHELQDVPMAPEWRPVVQYNKNKRYFYDFNRVQKDPDGIWMTNWDSAGSNDENSWVSQLKQMNGHIQRDIQYGEMEGGRDIPAIYGHPLSSHGAPVWEVISAEGGLDVYAAPMSHTVPCVGYAIHEENKPGKLNPDRITPIIQKNYNALREKGVMKPMKVLAVIKNLPPDGSYTFPDGTVIHQSDVVDPPKQGRKIVYCGDTADSRAMENLAQDANVVVHEATNTYLEGLDNGTNLYNVIKDAKIHGHSTPHMAGEFARKVNCKNLLLNHFSSRYKGDESIDSVAIMTRIERQAIKTSGLTEEHVAACWDFMTVPLPNNNN